MSRRPNRTSSSGDIRYLGLAAALVYLAAFTLPYWLPRHYVNVHDELYGYAAREPWRGVAYYAALGVLFGLYAAALRRASRVPAVKGGLAVVLASTAVFGLLLIPVQPFTSTDVYSYTFLGRVAGVLGRNPFVHTAREFAADPLYFIVTFRDLPVTAGYGPLWVAISAAFARLAGAGLLANLVLFKALAAGLHVGTAGLIFATLRRLAPDAAVVGTLFYAWNPLLLVELIGNGHNDAAVAALAALAFLLVVHGRELWAVPCVAAAALVKPVAVLWLPLVAIWLLARVRGWPARIGQGALVVVLALLPAAAAYAPFWAGSATFRGLLAQSDIYGNSLPGLAIAGLASAWPGASVRAIGAFKLLALVAFVPFYASRLWAVARGDDAAGRPAAVLRAGSDTVLFYLLFTGLQFWPWYLAWLMVPVALLAGAQDALRRRLAVAFCILAPLLYFPFGAAWTVAHLPGWALALLSALPVMATAAGLLAIRRRPQPT